MTPTEFEINLKKIETKLKQAISTRLPKKIANEAVRFFKDSFQNEGFKEYLNQPHEFYVQKNRLLLQIDSVLKNATYKGALLKKEESDRYVSHVFEISINQKNSWLIVRDYENANNCSLYSVSDNKEILNYLKK